MQAIADREAAAGQGPKVTIEPWDYRFYAEKVRKERYQLDADEVKPFLQLEKLHRHDVETKLPSGNWKATADGYLDGYHLGYLHRNTIGAKSITGISVNGTCPAASPLSK